MGRFFFVDIETTGLDENKDLILEIGVVLADNNLKVVDRFSVMVWSPMHFIKMVEMSTSQREADKIVYPMHQESGLWDECQTYGVSLEEAERRTKLWLGHHKLDSQADPVCGSNVANFDRKFMATQVPTVNEMFHYRNIDTSSVKELCRRLNPSIYRHLDTLTSPKKNHRVLDDCEDTINELQFYIDNFFWIEGDEKVA